LPTTGNRPTMFRCAVRVTGAMQRAADLGRSHGGIMRIGRKIIIPAIVALSAAGSIAASVAVPAATVAAPSTHVQVAAISAVPHTWYHL
jgi:hypothetical protein